MQPEGHKTHNATWRMNSRSVSATEETKEEVCEERVVAEGGRPG